MFPAATVGEMAPAGETGAREGGKVIGWCVIGSAPSPSAPGRGHLPRDGGGGDAGVSWRGCAVDLGVLFTLCGATLWGVV